MTTRAKPISKADLPVESKKLFVPDLTEVAEVLQTGLLKNFAQSSVTVTECPDLSQKPFRLAAKGLCGSPRLLEIGGPPNLVPTVTRHKIYDIRDYPSLAEFSPKKNSLVIGAGASDWTYLNRNAELMPNIVVNADGSVTQRTHLARTLDEDGSYKLQLLPTNETTMSLLGNLFLSEGLPGPVLEVRCKKRIGPENFVTCMRKALLEEYPQESIGVGGTFLIKQGKAKIHVMPDFSECPLNTDEDVANWLKFFEMKAPFTVLSYFVSQDPGLDLRIEHSHGFSEHGDGGHYHYDITPDIVEYIGYFNLGEYCYRVDRPENTHLIGRD